MLRVAATCLVFCCGAIETAHAECERLSSPRSLPASLRDVDLSCLDLSGRNLAGRDLRGSDLSGANLDRSVLDRADLRGANLAGARVRHASLVSADLSRTNLTATDFTGSQLRRARFEKARLVRTTFQRATLRGATFRFAEMLDVDLDEADLCAADLSQTSGLSENRGVARYCRATALPPSGFAAASLDWTYRGFYRPANPGGFKVRFLSRLSFSSYFDQGPDDPGEIDVFEDGQLSVTASLIGVDYTPPFANWSHRYWLSAIGVTTNLAFGSINLQEVPTTVFIQNLGAFVELFPFLVLEGGGSYGITTASGLNWDTRDDFSLYVGARIQADGAAAFFGDLSRALRGSN